MSRLLDNFRENWLSVKMFIYKEESLVDGVIFGVNKVEFLSDEVVKWSKNKDFDDMGYDMGLGREDWVFWLILLEILEVRFLSWCVKESAIWISEKISCGSSFCYPLYP